MYRISSALIGSLALTTLALTAVPTAQAAESSREKVVSTPEKAPKHQKKTTKKKLTRYIVKSGDTLTGIAKAQGQKYTDLLGRNKQFWANPDLIHPGAKVKLTGEVREIPAPKKPTAKPATSAPQKPQQSTAASSERASASGSPKAYARSVLNATQFDCVEKLWTRESGWNVYATNPSSGAYGIPQALPAGKMASAGSDWRTNGITQVKWGLKYLNERYGAPCGGWNHFLANNWY